MDGRRERNRTDTSASFGSALDDERFVDAFDEDGPVRAASGSPDEGVQSAPSTEAVPSSFRSNADVVAPLSKQSSKNSLETELSRVGSAMVQSARAVAAAAHGSLGSTAHQPADARYKRLPVSATGGKHSKPSASGSFRGGAHLPQMPSLPVWPAGSSLGSLSQAPGHGGVGGQGPAPATAASNLQSAAALSGSTSDLPENVFDLFDDSPPLGPLSAGTRVPSVPASPQPHSAQQATQGQGHASGAITGINAAQQSQARGELRPLAGVQRSHGSAGPAPSIAAAAQPAGILKASPSVSAAAAAGGGSIHSLPPPPPVPGHARAKSTPNASSGGHALPPLPPASSITGPGISTSGGSRKATPTSSVQLTATLDLSAVSNKERSSSVGSRGSSVVQEQGGLAAAATAGGSDRPLHTGATAGGAAQQQDTPVLVAPLSAAGGAVHPASHASSARMSHRLSRDVTALQHQQLRDEDDEDGEEDDPFAAASRLAESDAAQPVPIQRASSGSQRLNAPTSLSGVAAAMVGAMSGSGGAGPKGSSRKPSRDSAGQGQAQVSNIGQLPSASAAAGGTAVVEHSILDASSGAGRAGAGGPGQVAPGQQAYVHVLIQGGPALEAAAAAVAAGSAGAGVGAGTLSASASAYIGGERPAGGSAPAARAGSNLSGVLTALSSPASSSSQPHLAGQPHARPGSVAAVTVAEGSGSVAQRPPRGAAAVLRDVMTRSGPLGTCLTVGHLYVDGLMELAGWKRPPRVSACLHVTVRRKDVQELTHLKLNQRLEHTSNRFVRLVAAREAGLTARAELRARFAAEEAERRRGSEQGVVASSASRLTGTGASSGSLGASTHGSNSNLTGGTGGSEDERSVPGDVPDGGHGKGGSAHPASSSLPTSAHAAAEVDATLPGLRHTLSKYMPSTLLGLMGVSSAGQAAGSSQRSVPAVDSVAAALAAIEVPDLPVRPPLEPVWVMRWSHDGQYLAVGGGTDTGAVVRVWRVAAWPGQEHTEAAEPPLSPSGGHTPGHTPARAPLAATSKSSTSNAAQLTVPASQQGEHHAASSGALPARSPSEDAARASLEPSACVPSVPLPVPVPGPPAAGERGGDRPHSRVTFADESSKAGQSKSASRRDTGSSTVDQATGPEGGGMEGEGRAGGGMGGPASYMHRARAGSSETSVSDSTGGTGQGGAGTTGMGREGDTRTGRVSELHPYPSHQGGTGAPAGLPASAGSYGQSHDRALPHEVTRVGFHEFIASSSTAVVRRSVDSTATNASGSTVVQYPPPLSGERDTTSHPPVPMPGRPAMGTARHGKDSSAQRSDYVPGTATAAAHSLAAAHAQPPVLATHGAPFFESTPHREWLGHEAHVVDMAWSASHLLLTAGMDGFVRLWHVSRQECLHKFQHPDCVTSVAFHPNSDAIFLSGCFDRKLRVWSMDNGRVTVWQSTPSMPTAAAFSPDGRYAIAGLYSGHVVLFSTSEGLRFHRQIECRSTKHKKKMGPIAAGASSSAAAASTSSSHALAARGCKVTGIQFTPNGSHMLVTSNDSRVRLVSLDTCALVYTYKGLYNDNMQIPASFDSAGTRIVCGSEDGRVLVWRVRNDQHHPALNPRMSREDVSKVSSYEAFIADEGAQSSRAEEVLRAEMMAAGEYVDLGAEKYSGKGRGRPAVTVAVFAPSSALGIARPAWAAAQWCDVLTTEDVAAASAVQADAASGSPHAGLASPGLPADLTPSTREEGSSRGQLSAPGAGTGLPALGPGASSTSGEYSLPFDLFAPDGRVVDKGVSTQARAAVTGVDRRSESTSASDSVGSPSSASPMRTALPTGAAGQGQGQGGAHHERSHTTVVDGQGAYDSPHEGGREAAKKVHVQARSSPAQLAAAKVQATLGSHMVLVTADSKGVLRIYENWGPPRTV